MELILGLVASIAIAGLVITNVLWLLSLKFLVNTAISRTPLELAQRETITNVDKRPKPKPEPRPRPEGI